MSGTTKKGQTIKATSSAAAISNGNTYSPISSYASTDFDDKEDSAPDTREDSILTRLKDTLIYSVANFPSSKHLIMLLNKNFLYQRPKLEP